MDRRRDDPKFDDDKVRTDITWVFGMISNRHFRVRITPNPSGEDSGEPQHRGGTSEVVDEKVDIERRSRIIVEHYDGVSQEEATRIAELLKEHLTGTFSPRDLQADVETEVDFPHEQIETLVRTEVGSIQTMDRVRGYQDRPGFEEHVFKWTGASDSRTSPICTEVKEEIEARGGAVPLDELQELLRTKAEKYRDEGGTLERMDHWVPHEKCRHIVVRHVDF